MIIITKSFDPFLKNLPEPSILLKRLISKKDFNKIIKEGHTFYFTNNAHAFHTLKKIPNKKILKEDYRVERGDSIILENKNQLLEIIIF